MSGYCRVEVKHLSSTLIYLGTSSHAPVLQVKVGFIIGGCSQISHLMPSSQNPIKVDWEMLLLIKLWTYEQEKAMLVTSCWSVVTSGQYWQVVSVVFVVVWMWPLTADPWLRDREVLH